METNGANIFDRYTKAPKAKTLSNLLRSGHGALQEKPIWLVHPTPISTASLEFVFACNPSRASPFSAVFFKSVTALKTAFVQYIVADLVFTLHDYVPFERVSSLEEDGDDASRRVWTMTQTIVDTLTDSEFFPVVQSAADMFVRAVSYHMCFGFVPVGPDPESQPEAPPRGQNLRAYVRAYIYQIGESMARCSPLPVVEVCNNLIITTRNGEHVCTDYAGNAIALWQFTQTTPVLPGMQARSALFDMMQYEYQFVYASQQSRRQAIERMTKTNLVVSSAISKETQELLAHKNQPAFDPRSVAKSLRDDTEAIHRFDVESAAIKAAAGVDDPTSTNSFQQQLQVLKATLRDESSLQKTVARVQRRYRGQPDPGEDEEDRYIQRHNRGEIHAPPSTRRAAAKRDLAILQERELATKLKATQTKLTASNRERELLHDETLALLRNVVQLQHAAGVGKAEKDTLTSELTMTKKDQLVMKKQIERYEAVLSEMRTTVSTALDQVQAGWKERSRLMDLFSREGLSARKERIDSASEQERDVHAVAEFLFGATNFKNASTPSKIQLDKDMHRSHGAYSAALRACGVKIMPFFPIARDESSVSAYNEWLPFSWMYDTVIVAEAKESPVEDRTALVNTRDMVMVDINPKSRQDAEAVTRALEAVGVDNVLTGVFDRKFLNVQFPTQTNLQILETFLTTTWDHMCTLVFSLNSDAFTSNGQRLDKRLSGDSVGTYVQPFVSQLREGVSRPAEPITNVVSNFMDSFNDTRVRDIVQYIVMQKTFPWGIPSISQHKAH